MLVWCYLFCLFDECVRRTLNDLYMLDFLPDVMVKATIRVGRHFVILIEPSTNDECNPGHIAVCIMEGIQTQKENHTHNFGVIESDLSCLTYSSYTARFL